MSGTKDSRQQITREELLTRLQQFADDIGKKPSTTEMDKNGPHSSGVYKKRFGSWNNALSEAGLGKREHQSRKVDREELISELKGLRSKLGHSPSKKDMNEHGSYSAKTYQNRFGSWNSAKTEAGLSTTGAGDGVIENKIPKSDLLDELESLQKEVGRTPRTRDMSEHGKYWPTTYQDRFGSWGAALKESDCDIDYEVRRGCSSAVGVKRQYSNSDLLNHIQELEKEIGRVPTSSDMAKLGDMSEVIYIKRFGSWSNAVFMAGYNPGEIEHKRYQETPEETRRKISSSKKTPIESLINELVLTNLTVKFSGTDRVLKSSHMRGLSEYSGAMYNRRFKSLKHAGDICNVETCDFRRPYANNVSPCQLIDEVLKVAVEVGRPPYKYEVVEEGEYSAYQYRKLFGDWDEVLQFAGLPSQYSKSIKNGTEGAESTVKNAKGAANSVQDVYGSNWSRQRQRALSRDRWRCQHCGLGNEEHNDEYGQGLHVHHIVPIREFPRNKRELANILDNLISLCRECHQMWEGSKPEIEPDDIIENFSKSSC